MSLQELYRDAVIDHNRNPRNFSEMEDATHHSRGLNALCGDDIRVYLKLAGEAVRAASFIGQASAITMASASMMTEAIAGQSRDHALSQCAALDDLLAGEIDENLRLQLGPLAALEGVRQYPSRIRAARLPWQAMKAALEGREVASTE
ncbi:MAG: Fe-S cluster assembly sulfur transfer protein SufU [Pseudomonadota bacterium]